MNKRFPFLLLALPLLLGGCRSEKYTTALEAYERARPIVRLWHRDAVVLGIDSLRAEATDWGVRTDGTARVWDFTIASAGAERETEVWVKDGWVVRIGIEEELTGEVKYSPPDAGEPPDALPVAEMIDSDEAAAIALRAGATTSDTLYEMRITRYDECCNELNCRYISPAWVLTYTDPYDFSQQQAVLIDVVTGEVLCSDFAPQTTPTPASSAGK
jgi:hypothetical protein